MASIEEALVGILTAAAVAGGRVYPVKLPPNPQYPAVVYERVSGERVHAVDAPVAWERPRFRFHCWAESYADAVATAGALRLALAGYSGTASGVVIGSISIETDFDLVEPAVNPAAWRRVVDFRVSHAE